MGRGTIDGYIYGPPYARRCRLPNSDPYASLQSRLISPHSIDEEMEAQGCEVICPRSKSHADKQSDLGLKPRSRWWQN